MVERGPGGGLVLVERRRPEELAGQGGGGVERVASAVVPPKAGPHERADAHREARDAGPGASSSSHEATARGLPHRRRPPRRVRRQRAAQIGRASCRERVYVLV